MSSSSQPPLRPTDMDQTAQKPEKKQVMEQAQEDAAKERANEGGYQ